jgi:3-hydroxyacyl-[acyl-carrier-protein] dehydratase
MAAEGQHCQTILDSIPQQRPFRFVDEITQVDDECIAGNYRFRDDESFYKGHFPGNPITPGVILVETLAQIGVVALGIHLASKDDGIEAGDLMMVFVEANVEFRRLVPPGTQVFVEAKKVYFRRLKLKVEANMTFADGTVVCSGELSGMGVKSS